MSTERTTLLPDRCDIATYEDRLRARLAAPAARARLARAGVVLAIHECLKAEIVHGVREFFIWPIPVPNDRERYQSDVLSRNKDSAFEASCSWLVDMGAMTWDDVATVRKFRSHRHAVAHELLSYVIDPGFDVDMRLIAEAAAVVRRLGQFWGRISVDSDPEFDGREIADEDIRSGLSVFADFLVSVVQDD